MDTACLPKRLRYVYVLSLETILHALNFKQNYSKLFCSCSFTAMWIHSFPLSFNVFICLFLGPTCTKCLRYGICISCFIPQVNKELTPKFVSHSFLLPSERGIHTENQGMQRLDQVSVSFAKLCIVFPEQQPSACFPHRVWWILRLLDSSAVLCSTSTGWLWKMDHKFFELLKRVTCFLVFVCDQHWMCYFLYLRASVPLNLI